MLTTEPWKGLVWGGEKDVAKSHMTLERSCKAFHLATGLNIKIINQSLSVGIAWPCNDSIHDIWLTMQVSHSIFEKTSTKNARENTFPYHLYSQYCNFNHHEFVRRII